jgi:septum formation protein
MLQATAPRLILASGSASRRALLAAAGLHFEVLPAALDEAAVKREAHAMRLSAGDAALMLADCKAAAVAQQQPDAMVIGGDQILVCDGLWYDKPADVAGARDQLRTLRGRAHELATAVACWRGPDPLWQYLATPRLSMRRFSDAFLGAYLHEEAAAVTSTVGTYRLEGCGVQLFDEIEGDYTAILGLPLLPLLAFLREQGILFA